MGGMVVVGGVLAGGLGLGNTVVGLVGVLIGLLHLGRCLGAGIVVGLSEGGIVVVGGNIVVKALGGKVDVVVCMCGNVAVGGIVGISVKVAVGGIVGVSGKVVVGCVVIISGEVVVGGIVNLEHLVVLLAGPISHTSTRCMDFVEIFNIILDLSITCFSHFSGCWASFMFIVITLSWNAITCFLESSWVWDCFLLFVGISVEVIVGISVEVIVGGIFSFGAMAVGGDNVAVGLGFGSTVVVNVVDVVCPFCFCCVLGGGVVDPDLLLDRLQSSTKSTTFPCETFTIAS